MNTLIGYALKQAKKLIVRQVSAEEFGPDVDMNADSVSEKISSLLSKDEPCMVARFGGLELSTVVNYLGIHSEEERNVWKYLHNERIQWWWDGQLLQRMEINAGFYPASYKNAERFSEFMLDCAKKVDILGSWQGIEKHLESFNFHYDKVNLYLLEPFWSEIPWTKALANKKILVVHPFEQSIKRQYEKKDRLFNTSILPDFYEFHTLRAVQSVKGEKTDFTDWFSALDYMKSEIAKIDFDVCLLGCGAYGFPLAAYIKDMGKKAIHLGGVLQLLFGIKGKRWEDPNYGKRIWNNPEAYTSLFNDYWINPSENEVPHNVARIENKCYW